MSTITLQEAQATLADLVHHLAPGEAVTITENDRPVARLVSERPPERPARRPGLCEGMLVILAEDDEHLRDFAEYMP